MPTPIPTRARLPLALLLLAAAALAAWQLLPTSDKTSPAHTKKLTSTVPTKAAKAAVALPFPQPGATPSKNITTAYDPAKDRSKMSLELRAFASATSTLSPPRSLSLHLVSQFKGQTRPADYAELSVECSLSVVAAQAGILAPSSPPGEITADDKTITLLPSAADNLGYKSKPAPDGIHESLAFKLRTKDFLALTRAKSVHLSLASVHLTLSPANLADLHEFAAKMKPGS